jgi:hypothetical protein
MCVASFALFYDSLLLNSCHPEALALREGMFENASD